MLRSCDRKNIEKIRDYLNSNNFKQRVRNHGVEPLIRYHEYNNEFRAPTIYIDLSNNDGNIIKDLALKIYDKFKEKFGNEFEVLFDDRYQFTTFTSSLIIPFNRKNLNIIQGNIENAFPLSAPIEKNVDAKKMFEKISKKYPEIKGILSNNPKWENSDNVFNQNKDLTYQQVEKLFDENPEIANQVYEEMGFKDTPDVILPIGTSGSGKSTFIKSLPQENLVVIEPDAMRVEFTREEQINQKLQELINNKEIEENCKGNLKAEKGLATSFTKGGKWKVYEIFEGKSHKQGGIDISIKNNQISFTNKNGSIKAKYGLVISNSLVDTLPVMEDYAQDGNIIPQSQYKPTRAKDENIHYYAVQDKVSFYDKEEDLDSFWNKYKNRQDLYGYLTDYGKDSKGEYISLYKKSGNKLTNLFTTPDEYYDRIYKSDLENLKTKRINDIFDKYYKEKDYTSLKMKIVPDHNIKELEQPSYEEQRQWLADYIKSPLYKETLLNEYEKSGKNIKTIDSDIQNRYRRVKNVPIEEVKIHPKGYGYIRGITYYSENNPNEINNKTGQPDNIYNQSNPKGWSDYKTGHIQIDPNAKFLDSYVVGHELTHKSTEGNKYLTKFTRNKLLNSVNKDNLGSGYTDKQLNRSYNYLDNPTEVHARLTELKYMMHRYGIYNPMKEKMTKEHLIKALQNPYIRKSLDIEVLLDMLNNKGDVIDLMNTIAENKHNSNSDTVIG